MSCSCMSLSCKQLTGGNKQVLMTSAHDESHVQALHDNPQLLTLLQWGLAGRQGDPEQTDDEDQTPGDINCRVN